jgi:hypothetical protein
MTLKYNITKAWVLFLLFNSADLHADYRCLHIPALPLRELQCKLTSDRYVSVSERHGVDICKTFAHTLRKIVPEIKTCSA